MKQLVMAVIKILSTALLAGLMLFGIFWIYKYYVCTVPSVTSKGKDYSEYLTECADMAEDYVKVRGLNDEFCVFVDYGLPSGTPRVHVWSFKENKVVYSTYSMHGPGNGSTASTPVFSNKSGSYCSALGHFTITKDHGNRQKRGFRLKGMDTANRNAYSRGLMLHRSKWVDTHCWMKYIPLNARSCLGCVTVSSRGFNYLESLINSQQKNLLLWSFDSSI